MKNTLKYILSLVVLFLFFIGQSQIKNAKTTTEKISGNCGMCKTTIEKAGNMKNLAEVNWDQKSKMATITFDNEKTNKDEILKRIALAGYDNASYLAPEEVYTALPGCCQYDRKNQKSHTEHTEHTMNMDHQNHATHSNQTSHQNHQEGNSSHAPMQELSPVFDNYFLLKDALILSDANSAAVAATNLTKAIEAVKMDKLGHEEHMIWMKVMKGLSADAKAIADSKNIDAQRKNFSSLSDQMYTLAKSTKFKNPVYYQHCPMYNEGKGANWLSKENQVKNPYYGSQMMSCGKTVETL